MLLAAVLAIAPVSTIVSENVPEFRTGGAEGAVFTLEPKASDGMSIVLPEEDSLTVRGHELGDRFVFDETKELVFTAVFGEGWSYNSTYSHFFDGDNRAAIAVNGDGSVEFRFAASEGDSVASEKLFSVQINASVEELPKLYIDAAVPFDEIGKTEWVEANYTLTLGTKQFSTGDYEGAGFVKGRGNSSWQSPKKPYSIKLESKASLLDIPKTKKYAVIPGFHDNSLMRNYISYKCLQDLIGIDYVPKCEFVDVYLNGQYNGIYILVERIDTGKNKVDIEEADEENMTGGYLIEKNIQGKFSLANDIWFNCPYWANQTRDYFELHAPEPEGELREAMLAYLEGWVNDIHDCIMNGSGDYLDYVDTTTWIDFIILQEVSKNPDGNFKTSCWLYKDRDDDHMYMTAPWDFDFAYGLVDWNNASPGHNDVDDCPQSYTFEDFMIINSSNPWMKKLYETQPEFVRAIRIRYTEYRSTIIENMFDMIEEQAAYLSAVQVPNHELWGKNFTAGVNKLLSFLRGRTAWLDEQWLIEDGSADLDEALNIPGGELHFSTENEQIPFFGCVRGDALVGAATEDGGGVSFTAEMGRGDFMNFNCSFTGEGSLTLLVNGEEALTAGTAGSYFFTAPEAGTYEFRWVYAKGSAFGEAVLDDVSINFGVQLGDVDRDGAITTADAVIAMRVSMGILDVGNDIRLLDMDGSGTVDTADALILLRRSMGLL